MDIGIKGIGSYIPKKRMTAAEIAEETGIPEQVIAEKFGVRTKPIPQEHETTAYMGLEAAKKALQQADIDPLSIDLVIWNGAQHKDYPSWLAGLYIANLLGAENAWSFDMEAMCGSMMAAFDIAKSMMMARDDLNNVLIVSGYRNLDLVDLKKPDTHFMLDLAASGSAALLQKNYCRNLILASSFKGDGSFAEDCLVPVMGSKAWPPKPQDLSDFSFSVEDVTAFKKKLTERTFPNFYAVIRDALHKSGGLKDRDIDYLAILHFKRSAHDAVLRELGLKDSQTFYLDDFGHMGQNDQLISIEMGLNEGRIKPGDTVVCVGAGLGFVWAASVIRWG